MKLVRALRYCTIIAYQLEYSRKFRGAWIEIFEMPYSVGKWQQYSIVAPLDSVLCLNYNAFANFLFKHPKCFFWSHNCCNNIATAFKVSHSAGLSLQVWQMLHHKISN